MIKKGTKLYSILKSTCPKCHSTPLYINANPYRFSKILKMYDSCSNCSTKYKIEPSFFYGAMYVSYTLGVVLSILVFTISYFLGGNIKVSFIAIVIALIGLMPIIMRLSRNIWLNLFIKYDPRIK